MIQIKGLKKSFGRQLLFEEASFAINGGEKIGVTGRNGSGKTTLFRLILGEESPEEGRLFVPDGYRIGHLQQTVSFSAPTVILEAAKNMPPSETNSEETYRVKRTLLGLGFDENSFDLNPSMLSGGFQVRVELAKTLLSDPDLLLLDEPTNFLDILSIRWLKDFLRGWKKELMLITHDRDFMDSVCTHTIGIHRQHIKKIQGNTHKLYEQIILEEEVYERERINDERRRKEVEDFINRFRAKATKARQVQSRIKSLERMRLLEELRAIKELEFRFNYAPFQGRGLINVEGISFGYEDNSGQLISNLSLSIGAKDRIGIIGRNGRGKTTLLNLLAKELKPKKGEIIHNPKLRLAYFGQTNVLRLDLQKTVAEEIMEAAGDENIRRARTIAGIMLFEGDQSLKKVSVLSGGERSRVLLGKIIARPSNLLLLDEPTNHLDMESIDSLLEALEAFEGAVVIVTHSEMILRSIAERLVVFDNQGIRVFEGGYDDFLNKVGWKDEETAGNLMTKDNNRGINRKELKRKKAELINAKSRVLTPLQKRIGEIEEAIINHEQAVKEFTDELLHCSAEGQWQRCKSLSESLKDRREKIELLFEELQRVNDELTIQSNEFEEMLRNCEVQ